jgi:Protein of unknown function (DUF3000)
MTDTYARAMEPADEPGKRRSTRSRGTAAASASGTAKDLTPVPIRASGTPGAKPKRSRTPASSPKKSAVPSAAVPVPVPVPAARVPRQPTQIPGVPTRVAGSPAQETFAAAAAAFMAGREAQVQRELQFEDVPAPKRLAPYATAIAATIKRDDTDVAWGRLVLLYDPDGQQGWDGVFRLVAYIRAEVEPEIAADPLLGEVGWSWLSEALDAHAPGYAVPSGTVTRVITEGFGAKRDELPLTGFELRASWSPAGPGGSTGSSEPGSGPDEDGIDLLDLSAHIAAWCDCLSAAAGLEPPGTRALHQPGRG